MSEEQWTNTREALWFLARLTIFLLAVCGLYELLAYAIHGHCL